MACGAALYNLRLALAVHGTPAERQTDPDPRRDTYSPSSPRPGPDRRRPLETRLHAAIPRRHSNRLPFAEVPVPATCGRPDRAARAEGGRLDLADAPADVETIGKLTGERRRHPQPQTRRTGRTQAWIRGATTPPTGYRPPPADPPPARTNCSSAGTSAAGKTPRDYETRAALGVVGGFGDHPGRRRPGRDGPAAGAAHRDRPRHWPRRCSASRSRSPAVREQLRLALGPGRTPRTCCCGSGTRSRPAAPPAGRRRTSSA